MNALLPASILGVDRELGRALRGTGCSELQVTTLVGVVVTPLLNWAWKSMGGAPVNMFLADPRT